MGDRWIERWPQIGLTRRRALPAIGGMAAGAGLAGPRKEAAMAQETATPSPLPPDFKVVFHVGQAQNWPFVLSNLRNVTNDWPQAQLRVVVDGSAVLVLQGQNSLTDELGAVAAKGVTVQVCPNALAEHKIDPATIPSYATTTLGGVVALVTAQREGYAYIKP